MASQRLWQAYRGSQRIADISPWCVIDRCAAGVGEVAIGPGARPYSLRPRAPEQSTVDAYRDFFARLQRSIAEHGVKLPVLLWHSGGRLYVRYGASRIHVSERLGRESIPAVVCDFDKAPAKIAGFDLHLTLGSPAHILAYGFDNPAEVGSFEASHERLDAHHMETW